MNNIVTSLPIFPKGIALITALFLIAFLLVIGLTFQTTITDDLHFVSREQAALSSHYLARSGMEYYGRYGMPEHPLEIPPGNPQQICVISQDAGSGDLQFTGIVSGPTGKVLARQTLVAPGGDLVNWYVK